MATKASKKSQMPRGWISSWAPSSVPVKRRFPSFVNSPISTAVSRTLEFPKLRNLPAILLARLRVLWPWLIVGVLLWVGWGQLRRIDLPSVRGLLGQTESGIMLLLLAATAVNLILAGFYDVAAFGPASRPPG